jgi:hypothetical protein
MNDKTIKLRVPDEDLKNWNARADAERLSLSAWIRKQCAGVVPYPDMGPTFSEVAAALPDDHPVVKAVAEAVKPKSAKQELQEAVASRTRHPVGHQCFECMQAERFFKAMRKEGE